MNIKEKYFINRLGFENQIDIDKCKTIYDYLGYIIINITKNNEKSFRCDYSKILYNEIPKEWIEYSEKTLHKTALYKLAKLLHAKEYFYKKRLIKAFDLLNENDKKIVIELIKVRICKEVERYKEKVITSIDVFILNDDSTIFDIKRSILREKEELKDE